MPIGQGIAVTPMQLAAAYAAVANEGMWMRPHLVDRVVGGARKPVADGACSRRGIAREVIAMLENVVAEGTGTLAAVPGYNVAGKTGTAQEAGRARRLLDLEYVSSFVGILPATRRGSSSSCGRRAARRDLGRRRRGTGVPSRSRGFAAPVPRGGVPPDDPAGWPLGRVRPRDVPEGEPDLLPAASVRGSAIVRTEGQKPRNCAFFGDGDLGGRAR